MITPREYQIEALEAVYARRRLGVRRQLISLPTGCGKTVVFALLAKELNVRTLVVAHAEELIAQAIAKFKMIWPEVNIGVVKAESDDVEAHVVVASIQTAARDKRLQRLKEQNFSLLIVDECHHAAAPSYSNLVNELGFFTDPEKLLVGVTATPKRGDGVGLKTIFQEIVFERSINTMIRAGYLSPLVGKQIFTKMELRHVGIRNGDFISSELSKAINTPERNRIIINNYKLYAAQRKKSLAFCVDVQHAKDLAEAFNQQGIPALAVYGAMPDKERALALSLFSNGKYSVLTNCQLLTEGFDEPSIDCVIMGRPTQSTALFTQMIGRGTRTFPLKRDCLVLDFTDNVSKHNLCTYKNTLDGAVATLFDQESSDEAEECYEPNDDEIFDLKASKAVKVLQDRIEDIEFFDSAHFAWNPVGDSWHLRLAADRDVWVRQTKGGFLVVAQDASEVFNLSNRPLPLDYALGVAEDWARKQTSKSGWARKDAEWRSEPATAKQIETLSRLGFVFDSGISKGQASQLLDSKFSEPATVKQVGWLRAKGISLKHPITKFEARKMIANMKGG